MAVSVCRAPQKKARRARRFFLIAESGRKASLSSRPREDGTRIRASFAARLRKNAARRPGEKPLRKPGPLA